MRREFRPDRRVRLEVKVCSKFQPCFLAVERTVRRTGGRLTLRSGSGFQAAMVLANSRACALSAMPGNRRRSSTAAENSPPWLNAARIAAASASVTTNIVRAWEGRSGSASCF